MSAEVGKYRLVGFLSCFYLLMLRGVDLIDIVGWEIVYIFHVFYLFNQSFLGTRGAVDFFWEMPKFPPHAFTFFATG